MVGDFAGLLLGLANRTFDALLLGMIEGVGASLGETKGVIKGVSLGETEGVIEGVLPGDAGGKILGASLG